MANILIIGSGAFGTALSQPLIDNNNNVYFYSKNQEVSEQIMNGKHPLFPNIKIKPPKKCFNNYDDAFNNNIDIVLLCAPSKSLISIYEDIKKYLNENIIIINTAKGLNPTSQNGVWSELFGIDETKKYALIVGPSFAEDVINKHKTIINVVSSSFDVAKYVMSIFNNNYFKLVYFDDENVASLCSSLKNALAIGLGLVSFLDNSMNTHSAFLTIGLSEIQKLISTLTGNNKTQILDFFGVGDIFLTCSSDMSRNYRFGYQLGQFGLKQTIEQLNKQTVEGYRTIEYINKCIETHKINLPLFSSLYEICYKEKDPKIFLDLVWNKIN